MPTDARLLLLDRDAVEPALQAGQVMAAVREAFVLHSQRAGRVFPVVREKLHTGGVFGIKSGDVAGQDLLGFKAAGFWPANRTVGGEPHQATVALFDPATGRPLCIMDGNAITTARTGAAGGLGLQQLARRDSTRLCVFGTGVQARVQLDYALRLLPQRCTVQYVNVSGEPDPVFESHFVERCTIGVARDRNDAVADSDVVITATPGGGLVRRGCGAARHPSDLRGRRYCRQTRTAGRRAGTRAHRRGRSRSGARHRRVPVGAGFAAHGNR